MEIKYRQGDLIFIKIDELPKNLKTKDDLVIVKGTGISNQHISTGGKIYIYEKDLSLGYLELIKSETIQHRTLDGKLPPKNERHNNLKLSKGFWEIKRKREYLPKSYQIIQD